MGLFFALVPIFTFLFLFAYFLQKDSQYSIRENLSFAAVTWASLVVIMTEILSVFHLFSFHIVLTCWCLITFSLIWFVFKTSSIHLLYQKLLEKFLGKFSNIDFKGKMILIGVGIILCITGFIATISPPNNVDSLVYHLARIPYWIQNQSVEHYPTYTPRQLYQPPWAEFTLLHFHLLTASDILANYLQWFAAIGTLLNVSLITKQLGGKKQVQIIAIGLTASLPMLIAQSSSTQNDLVMTFWFTCFIFLFLRFRESYRLSDTIFLGLSIGLTFLTKGTGYLYVLPFCIYLIIQYFRSFQVNLLKLGVLIGLLALLLNWGHYTRNWQIYHHPIGPPKESKAYTNGTHHPLNMLSNLVRNCSLHLGTYNEAGNDFVHRYLKTFHYLIGIDESDPRTTSYQTFTMISNLSEDGTGNPFHFLLLCFCIFAFSFSFRQILKFQDNTFAVYLFLLLSAFVIFCFSLKWQPFHSRLHLALFCALMPFVAIFFNYKNWLKTLQVIVFFLLFASIPWLFFVRQRPLISFDGKSILQKSREEITLTSLEEDHTDKVAIETVKWINNNDKIRKIGLIIDEQTIDYGLYVLLNNYDKKYEIRHIQVVGEGKFEPLDFTPDAILNIRTGGVKEIIWNNRTYRLVKPIDQFGIFQ